MAGRKRSSGKGRGRSGLSGNPLKRAGQLQQRGEALPPLVLDFTGVGGPRVIDPLGGQDSGVLSWPGITPWAEREAPQWWRPSYDRLVGRARRADWPASPLGVETMTAELVGDAFFRRISDESFRGIGGLVPTEWLRRLILHVGKVLGDDLQAAEPVMAAGWPALLAFLRGLAMISPVLHATGAEGGDESPREEAFVALDRIAGLSRGAGLAVTRPEPFAVTGAPLVARDAYESRFLLVAPFGDHHYAWDIDACRHVAVLAGGVFASAADALAEWRGEAGPATAEAVLGPCPPDLVARLLRDEMGTTADSESIQGREPREYERERFRLRRRAQELAISIGCSPTPSLRRATAEIKAGEECVSGAMGDFLAWHAGRAAGGRTVVPEVDMDDLVALADVWYTTSQSAEWPLYSCSPHRTAITAVIVADFYLEEHVATILGLLPDWVDWCIERSGLASAPADRACAEAARAARDKHPKDDRPFRAPEW